MEIRYATIDDLDDISAVEALCFPPLEAASRSEFKKRLMIYPQHFLLMFENNILVSFVDGFVSDEKDLTDIMFADASLHNEEGRWQMIFGVNTIPDYRRRGYAEILLKRFIEDAKNAGRSGVVLTAKEEKLHYYQKFGFINEGVSESAHGGATWYQMRITF